MLKRNGTDESGGGEAGKRQKSHDELLKEAAQRGNLEECKKIVEECQSDEREKLLNWYNVLHERTLLHTAAMCNQPRIVSWMFSSEEGGGRSLGFNNFFVRTTHRETVLHVAAKTGHLEVCKAIVNGLREDNGERQEMINSINKEGYTALHFAATYEEASIASWLLSSEDGGGRSLGFNNILARTAKEGETALYLAARHENSECFFAIVNGCRVENGERLVMLNARTNDGQTVLHVAALYKSVPIASWLLSEEEGGGRSLGFSNILTKSISERDTALHFAVESESVECFHAIVNGLRVDNGERQEMLNARTNGGKTVLHLAVLCNNVPLISWLLSAEEGGGRSLGFTNVLAKTYSLQDSALLFAAIKGFLEACKAIVNGCRVDNGERQAMINAVDSSGHTVLHIAAQNGNADVIEWVLSEDGGRAAGFNLVTAKATQNMCTALYDAVGFREADAVRALLSNCTIEERMNLFLDVDPAHRRTPLHHAAGFGQSQVMRELLSYPECRLIANVKDLRGMTALHRAIIGADDDESCRGYRFRGDEQIIRALLGFNDDSSSSSSTTSTAIDPNIGVGLL